MPELAGGRVGQGEELGSSSASGGRGGGASGQHDPIPGREWNEERRGVRDTIAEVPTRSPGNCRGDHQDGAMWLALPRDDT